MTNEVAERKSAFAGKVSMVNTAALAKALEDSAAKDPRGGGAEGSDFLNFSGKGGRYGLGKDQNDVSPDEAWLVNIGAFEDGWICWKDNKPAATRLYPLGQPVPTPDASEHGPFTRDGDGWYQAKSMTLKSIDTGVQAYFKINSISGVSAFAGLQKDVLQRIRTGLPAWPVIGLDKEKFQAQSYTNWKPVIKVMGWLNDENVEKLAELFEDEKAEIDLEALFIASAQPTAITSGGNTAANGSETVARRNRRAPL